MRYFDITQYPLKIHGLAVTDSEKRQFWKLPLEMMEKMPRYDFIGRAECTMDGTHPNSLGFMRMAGESEFHVRISKSETVL